MLASRLAACPAAGMPGAAQVALDGSTWPGGRASPAWRWLGAWQEEASGSRCRLSDGADASLATAPRGSGPATAQLCRGGSPPWRNEVVPCFSPQPPPPFLVPCSSSLCPSSSPPSHPHCSHPSLAPEHCCMDGVIQGEDSHRFLPAPDSGAPPAFWKARGLTLSM